MLDNINENSQEKCPQFQHSKILQNLQENDESEDQQLEDS